MPACARPPAKRRDNERLEFLGDRVLGLAIAELLSEVYPAGQRGRAGPPLQSPGARRHLRRGGARARSRAASLVLSEAEAEQRRARQGDDPGRRLRGPARRHLPGGRLRQGARRSCARTGAPGSTARRAEAADAKSALQEWAQGQGLDLPDYVEVARQGPDHAPRFTAEVRIKGRKPARGEGASKRAAEQAAATALLAREGVWEPSR